MDVLQGFYNLTEMCDQLYHISDDIQNYVEHRVNGLRYSLNFGTMHRIKMCIKWMSERMINESFRLYNEFLTSLTGEKFINFRQEDMKYCLI